MPTILAKCIVKLVTRCLQFENSVDSCSISHLLGHLKFLAEFMNVGLNINKAELRL